MATQTREIEMLQRGQSKPVFARASVVSMAFSDVSDVETEFEDDMSDFDDYNGRRSEDSYGKRSDTTISTFEELRTPGLNEHKTFNFRLPSQESEGSPKKIVGPMGPHLFRYSFESAPENEVTIAWSPVESPQWAGPVGDTNQSLSRSLGPPPASSVPLECWTPQQVASWVRAKGLGEVLVQCLLVNDISGAILKELKFGDLTELGIESFGQRHQLWNEIRSLRGSLSFPPTQSDERLPSDGDCHPPQAGQSQRASPCSNPPSPEDEEAKFADSSRRRARRALRPDDVISPAESASIVAIEQLLPKPHHCSKGENCAKWRRQQRQLARIAKEFPLELEQIGQANAESSSEVNFRPTSEAGPSVVASSDLLGPSLPTLRLDEDVLRVVPPRDPQESVRQFLNFQHLDEPETEQPQTPPYDLFPPLSPPTAQLPHSNLSKLPKLTIPAATADWEPFSADRTVIRQTRSPVTAVEIREPSFQDHNVLRIASPASTMDMPLTAMPLAPIARDTSQSVPPNMQYRNVEPFSRSQSRTANQTWEPVSPIKRPATASNHHQPSGLTASSAPRHQRRSRRLSFALAPLEENAQTQQFEDAESKPSIADKNAPNFAGWMKKRKTKMLRHEWHENHFRLNGTKLAMHRDSKDLEALECIDVDDYAVACSSVASNKKLTAAFKNLKMAGGSKKKDSAEDSASAFQFQLIPSLANVEAGKGGMLAAAMHSASGKTHHFSVKTQDDRIDWMRELMLAKALKEKGRGCEVNLNGNML